MGHFTEDALQKFNSMCLEGMDFGESPVYDFTRCVKASGETYGTDGQCKIGRETAPKAQGGATGKSLKNRLGALRAAFERKMGRKMTPKELARAQRKFGIGVPIPKGKSAEDILEGMLPKGGKVVPTKEA
mgnify:CR=1 FL=1